MHKKHFQTIIFSFAFFVFAYYAFVFFTNYDRIQSNLPTAKDIISDYDKIRDKYKIAVENTYYLFSLDSASNFNPQSPLLKIDALKIIDIIGSQNVKDYGTSTNVIPYFKDYKESDVYANVIKRVVGYIDQIPNFPKHYEILGYELNKNEPITRLEFLMLISSFFEKSEQTVIYKDVPAKFIPYISSLSNLGIISDSSVLNADKAITREEVALIVYKTIQILAGK